MKLVMTTLVDGKEKALVSAQNAISSCGLDDVGLSLSVNQNGDGYVAGVNKALKQVEKGEYFCLMNDDSIPVTDDWLALLLEELEKRRESLSVWFAGPSGGCRTAPQMHGRIGDQRRPTRVKHLAGFCLLCSPDVLEKVGFLDTRYIHYAGEVDWQWRAKEMGANCLWVPGVYVKHDVHEPNEEWWGRDHEEMKKVWSTKSRGVKI